MTKSVGTLGKNPFPPGASPPLIQAENHLETFSEHFWDAKKPKVWLKVVFLPKYAWTI